MKNRVLVIGGAGGIGSKISQRYADAGFEVIVADIDETLGNRVVQNLAGSHAFMPLDVMKNESIAAFADALQQRFGWVSHVVSVAGRAIPGEFGGLGASTFAIIEESVRLNLESHILLTKALGPLVEQSPRDNRTFTFISSINAVKGFGLPAYSAAKAGLLGLVHSCCGELGAKNIRINAVLPGTVETPVTQKEPKNFERLKEGTVLGRTATAGEIAEVVFALAEQMTCVTGQHIIADCGQTMKGYL